MIKPTVYLGADHGGFELKTALSCALTKAGYTCVDEGDTTFDAQDDYPLFALMTVGMVASEPASVGILICRSAAGMTITANKLAGVRAVAAADVETARLARAHNDANVLALPGDRLDEGAALEIALTFLKTSASTEARHVRRRAEIARVESQVPDVHPGIFETDVAVVNQRIAQLEALGAMIHVDVADNKLVPTMAFAQPHEAGDIHVTGPLEVHLMVERPGDYVLDWVNTGATRLIGHVEAPGFGDFVTKALGTRAETYAAIDLGTGAERLQRYVDDIDGVLVMAVKAGKSGQTADVSVLAVIAKLRADHPNLPILVDGGVNEKTAAAFVAAGANQLTPTSYLKNSTDMHAAYDRLRHLRGGADA